MSEIDLDAVQTRATMATRGPWHVEWDGTGYPQRVLNDAAVLVAETCTGPEWPPTDAEFIAHARTDVPALLARIAELEAARLQNLAAAEASGYERAVARLRDSAAVNAYLDCLDWPETRIVPPRVYADYLDAVKEGNDG